jgi:phosphatidate phosphatase APP1
VPQKIQNLTEYRALYPEYKLVLVGDNGQADGVCAGDSYSTVLLFHV